MVAEVEPKTSKVSPRKPRNRFARQINLLTRNQAKNLYVLHQVGAAEVATQTGLTVQQVYKLAEREGWTKLRREIKGKSIEAANARMSAEIDEMVEAVAIKSAVLSLGSLDAAIDELKQPGENQAKNMQAWSVASKNFVATYRQAKQLDVNQDAGQGAQINVMFVGQLPKSSARIERNITPAQSSPSPSVGAAFRGRMFRGVRCSQKCSTRAREIATICECWTAAH